MNDQLNPEGGPEPSREGGPGNSPGPGSSSSPSPGHSPSSSSSPEQPAQPHTPPEPPRHLSRWRGSLRFLVPVYAAAIAWKNSGFDRGSRLPLRLQWPVISVGSLSAGGAGKTPFLIALAELLRNMGYTPDVLSRGFGRQTRGILQVDVAGTADNFGDEPLLIARTLSSPVFVGADRFAAGILAESRRPGTPNPVHLLDDGFAHRRLARTIDIVLVTAADMHDRLLPAGNLREPWTSLRRARIVVLRAGEADRLRPAIDRRLGPRHGTPVWTISRRLVLPDGLPRRPLVFCGIARPWDFLRSLREGGIDPAATHLFRDHHRYRPSDATRLQRLAQRARADGFLTTAKDAVKLTPGLRALLETVGPIAIADLAVDLHDPAACATDLRQLLGTEPKSGTET